jgi:predicted PurR-regulated permease PerM
VPSVGTGLVAIPAILYLFAIGHAGAAIGLAIWSALLVGTIDNLLNPIVVGKNINVPPLLILFSVLGGISLLGPVGILIGPLTVSLLYALVSLYRHREIQ